MAALETIRAAIVAKAAMVPNIGRVHEYQRYDTQASGLQGLYRASVGGVEQLRGWFVTRKATQELGPYRGRTVVIHQWELRGYLGLSDALATEKTMDALIEALRDAFRSDETLGGVVDSTVLDDGAGLQLEEQQPVLFAGVLCHMARLTLRTRHYL